MALQSLQYGRSTTMPRPRLYLSVVTVTHIFLSLSIDSNFNILILNLLNFFAVGLNWPNSLLIVQSETSYHDNSMNYRHRSIIVQIPSVTITESPNQEVESKKRFQYKTHNKNSTKNRDTEVVLKFKYNRNIDLSCSYLREGNYG